MIIATLLLAIAGGSSYLADMGPAPAVELIDARGRPARLADHRDKVVLVSFIYTTCSGVCPATTHNLYRIQEELRRRGLWGKAVAFVSITLDPERDTPEVLARYAALYGCDPEHWSFLTGPPDRVAEVLSSWDMWARRNAEGVLDHPSRIFLIDPRGHRREIYNLEFLTAQSVAADVEELLREAAAGDTPKAPAEGRGTGRP